MKYVSFEKKYSNNVDFIIQTMGHTHSIMCKSCTLRPAVYRIVHEEKIEACNCDLRECQCQPPPTILSGIMTLFEPVTPRRFAEPCSRCDGGSYMLDLDKCSCSYPIRARVLEDKVDLQFKEIESFATNHYHDRETNIYSFQFFACSTCAATSHEWMCQPTLEYDARGFNGRSFLSM